MALWQRSRGPVLSRYCNKNLSTKIFYGTVPYVGTVRLNVANKYDTVRAVCEDKGTVLWYAV